MLNHKRGWAGVLTFTGVLAAIAIGCYVRAGADGSDADAPPALRAATRSAPASAPGEVLWDNSAKGVKLKYPADWQPRKNPDYELMLLPAGAAGTDRRLTMDIPDLPPHLPFMIQMSRVEHDYVQDLKKEHPELRSRDAADVKLPDCTARLVRSSWREGKTEYEDVALLIIHASAVYILDARSDESHLPPTRAAFDSIQSSIQWTRR